MNEPVHLEINLRRAGSNSANKVKVNGVDISGAVYRIEITADVHEITQAVIYLHNVMLTGDIEAVLAAQVVTP